MLPSNNPDRIRIAFDDRAITLGITQLVIPAKHVLAGIAARWASRL